MPNTGSSDEMVSRVVRGLADFPALTRVFPERRVRRLLAGRKIWAAHPVLRWASRHDADSRRLCLGGLDRALGCLQAACVEGLGDLQRALQGAEDRANFASIVAEIRVAAHFVRHGSKIALQPLVVPAAGGRGKGKRGDVLVKLPDGVPLHVEVYSPNTTQSAWELWDGLASVIQECPHRAGGNYTLHLAYRETDRMPLATIDDVVRNTASWLEQAPSVLAGSVVVAGSSCLPLVTAEPDELPAPHSVGLVGDHQGSPMLGGVDAQATAHTVDRVRERAWEKVRGGQLPCDGLVALAVEVGRLGAWQELCLASGMPELEYATPHDWGLPPEVDWLMLCLFGIDRDDPWGNVRVIPNPSSALLT